MMDRRRFLLTSLAGVLAAPLAAEGQLDWKAWRIGVLSGASRDLDICTDSVRQGLASLGYIEGRTHHIELRRSEGQIDSVPRLAKELVHSRVDVMVVTSLAIEAAKQATSTIPIVMSSSSYPVARPTEGTGRPWPPPPCCPRRRAHARGCAGVAPRPPVARLVIRDRAHHCGHDAPGVGRAADRRGGARLAADVLPGRHRAHRRRWVAWEKLRSADRRRLPHGG